MTVAEAITNRGAPSAPELISLLDERPRPPRACAIGPIAAVAAKVSSGGKLDNAALEREQRAAHGLAWVATYVEALVQVASYAKRMHGRGQVRRDGEPACADRRRRICRRSSRAG